MRKIILFCLVVSLSYTASRYSCGPNGYLEYLQYYPSKCGNDCDKYAEYDIYYICEIVNTLKLMKHLA